MSNLIHALEQKGCNMEETMPRFMQDEEFYEECYKQALEDEEIEKLGKALQNHDIRQAFESAHTLKGVLANMGLTPLHSIMVKIVETLRMQSEENLEETYGKFLKKRDEFRTLTE